jgi:hypothetical protein
MIKNKHMNLSHKLYMGQGTIPTVDRPKVFKPSEIFVWDNKCSALDAEWECYPYALASCEQYRGTDGYLQCMDDRFHACRQAAGCNYTYNTSPSTCRSTPQSRNLQFSEAVRVVCDDPTKEFPSPESYNACVQRMWDWSRRGCANVEPNEVSGKVVGTTGW